MRSNQGGDGRRGQGASLSGRGHVKAGAGVCDRRGHSKGRSVGSQGGWGGPGVGEEGSEPCSRGQRRGHGGRGLHRKGRGSHLAVGALVCVACK